MTYTVNRSVVSALTRHYTHWWLWAGKGLTLTHVCIPIQIDTHWAAVCFLLSARRDWGIASSQQRQLCCVCVCMSVCVCMWACNIARVWIIVRIKLEWGLSCSVIPQTSFTFVFLPLPVSLSATHRQIAVTNMLQDGWGLCDSAANSNTHCKCQGIDISAVWCSTFYSCFYFLLKNIWYRLHLIFRF